MWLLNDRRPLKVAQNTIVPNHDSEYVISSFRTEEGLVLPQATIRYSTYGTLNGDGSNVILVPAYYRGQRGGYTFWIGPGMALDTEKFFVIETEMFGNGKSSSPSNAVEQFYGPRFPFTSIRDNVKAVHELLVNGLGVRRLKAVAGFSMGGQQAFQWPLSYPGFVEKIVSSCGAAKTYGHGYVRLEGQIFALVADKTFNSGNYGIPPRAGIDAFSMVWGGWLWSQEVWRRELWKELGIATFEGALQSRRAAFALSDANDLIHQARTWQRHNVGDTPGFEGDIELALKSIDIPVLYITSRSDLYFPLGDAEYEISHLSKGRLAIVDSVWGHPAGSGTTSDEDFNFVSSEIAKFLSS